MGNRSRPAGVAATVVLLVVHGFLFGATLALLGLLVMGTDPCGSVKCGDPVWIDRAMRLGVWGGAAVLVADVGVAVYLLVRRKPALIVPIIGCVAQVGLATARRRWSRWPARVSTRGECEFAALTVRLGRCLSAGVSPPRAHTQSPWVHMRRPGP